MVSHAIDYANRSVHRLLILLIFASFFFSFSKIHFHCVLCSYVDECVRVFVTLRGSRYVRGAIMPAKEQSERCANVCLLAHTAHCTWHSGAWCMFTTNKFIRSCVLLLLLLLHRHHRYVVDGGGHRNYFCVFDVFRFIHIAPATAGSDDRAHSFSHFIHSVDRHLI